MKNVQTGDDLPWKPAFKMTIPLRIERYKKITKEEIDQCEKESAKYEGKKERMNEW